MSDGTDIKESVKEPVKNLTKEIVGDIVYRIAKACTKRAIKELKEELKEKAFRRLQQRLKNILESEEKIEKKLHKSIEQVVEETSKDSAQRIDFVRGIEQAFGEGAKKSFTSLSKVLTTFQTIVITTSVIVSGGIGASIPIIVKDTTPPEVSVSHSVQPNRRVTFTARASDNDAIDRIELLVDGHVVWTCSSSPCTYVGGPYPEGTTVKYAAKAYDKAGNSSGTGNRYFGVEDITPPEVTVSHSPGPGRQVTFTAKARDNVAIDRIELLVDEHVVWTCSSSPCTYVGGPYPRGTTINYAANAIDEAGNSTSTSSKSVYISYEVAITHLLVSPDGGTIFVADRTTQTIYRSTDDGLTWMAAKEGPGATITAVAVSRSFDTDGTVFAAATVAGNGRLYRSTNGGVTFAQAAPDIPGEVIESIALSPNFATDQQLIVGTSNPAANAYGDVYSLTGPSDWEARDLNEDVTAVVFSPHYPVDPTVLAVGSHAKLKTRLHYNFDWTGWDAMIPHAVINDAGGLGDANPIVSSAIALPLFFFGIDETERIAFVATSSGANDDVYRVLSRTKDMNVTPAGDNPISSLAYYSGDVDTLIAGARTTAQVYWCNDPLKSVPSWLPAKIPPTGSTNTQVALSPDFETDNIVYAGTSCTGSAFSMSRDGGATFYPRGLK